MTYQHSNPIEEFIIKPMSLMYQAPPQMRSDPRALPAFYALIQQKLAGFSADALEKGWDDLTTSKKTWTYPTIAEIVESVLKYSASSGSSANTKEMPWEARRRKAKEMAAEYVEKYKQRMDYFDAKREGWHWPLECFLRNMAEAQAYSMLNEAQNHSTFVPSELLQFAPNDDAYRIAAQDIFTARHTGQIDVALPDWLVAAWKRDAGKKQPKVTGDGLAHPLAEAVAIIIAPKQEQYA